MILKNTKKILGQLIIRCEQELGCRLGDPLASLYIYIYMKHSLIKPCLTSRITIKEIQ